MFEPALPCEKETVVTNGECGGRVPAAGATAAVWKECEPAPSSFTVTAGLQTVRIEPAREKRITLPSGLFGSRAFHTVYKFISSGDVNSWGEFSP